MAASARLSTVSAESPRVHRATPMLTVTGMAWWSERKGWVSTRHAGARLPLRRPAHRRWAENGEFLTAQPAHHIFLPQALLGQGHKLAQHIVPRHAPGVVDFLEVVEVQRQHGQPWRVRWALLMALSSSVR